MKAEELLIGDWLFYKSQIAAFPFKVEQITKKKVGYHAEPGDNRIYYLRLSECNPIPLTPDGLERNGFVNRAQDLYVLTIDNGVYPYPSMIFVEYNILTKSLFINDMMLPKPVQYLHELQNALMVCGINKEIVL